MKTNTLYTTGLALLFVVFFSINSFATKWVITVQNFMFSPSSLSNVIVGDTIHWDWINGSHTTTSTTIPAGADTWDNPLNSGSTSFEYKVTLEGTYNYKCTPHQSMGMVGSFTASASTPTLFVTPLNQDVNANAGTTNFSVTSNSTWTASSNAGWCSVTPSGTGSGTISADYTENTSVTSRTATITILVTGLPAQPVTVSQAGAAPTLAVSPSNQNVSGTSGSVDFTVTSNTNWTAGSDASWCTVTPSGTGNGTVVANFSANSGGTQRVANITLTVSGLAPQVVTVTQDFLSGVVEHKSASIQIYPNPTSGVINIVPQNLPDVQWIKVMDITGRTLFLVTPSGNGTITLDLSGRDDGYYFIQVASASGPRTEKVILRK